MAKQKETAQAIDFDFSVGAQKKGTKVSESNTPELTLDSSYGKFSLNTKAMELMGVKVGSHVLLYDMQHAAEGDQSRRFYISAIDYVHDGKALGAIIGKQKSFNFSGVYNSILADDPEQKDTIQRELMKQGKLVASDYGKTVKYVATKKGIMTLQEVGERVLDLNERWGIDDTVTVTIFALGQAKFLDHKPQAAGETYSDLSDLYAARKAKGLDTPENEDIDAGMGDEEDDS